jgi:hypothetical protein
MASPSLYGLLQRKLGARQRRFLYRHAFNAYPPFVGAGIRITHVGKDLRSFHIAMKLRPWNRNYVGTHFGGSLYAMCDPWYMILVMEALGPEFIVWDKAASIRFRKPGRGTVRAEFHLSEGQIAELKKIMGTKPKHELTFPVEVKSESGEVVAEVEKLIYVRKKDAP